MCSFSLAACEKEEGSGGGTNHEPKRTWKDVMEDVSQSIRDVSIEIPGMILAVENMVGTSTRSSLDPADY